MIIIIYIEIKQLVYCYDSTVILENDDERKKELLNEESEVLLKAINTHSNSFEILHSYCNVLTNLYMIQEESKQNMDILHEVERRIFDFRNKSNDDKNLDIYLINIYSTMYDVYNKEGIEEKKKEYRDKYIDILNENLGVDPNKVDYLVRLAIVKLDNINLSENNIRNINEINSLFTKAYVQCRQLSALK